MNRLLATLVILLAVGLLIQQSVERGSIYTHLRGEVLVATGDQEILDDVLYRGDVVKTQDGFALVAFGDMRIGMAERTEIQLVSPSELKLIGGRILVSEGIFVDTPWIDTSSSEPFSVVNFAWDARVQILPLGASTVVENTTIGRQEIMFPAEWVEEGQQLTLDEAPFDPETSSEAAFYAWAQDRIKEELGR